MNNTIPDRNEIDSNLKWNLKDIYPNIETWKKHKQELNSKLSELTKLKGNLTKNSDTLYQSLEFFFNYTKDIWKLNIYAHLLSDQDLNLTENQALMQEASNLANQMEENSAFIIPELLQTDENQLKSFIRENARLSKFDTFIEDILRLKKHTLPEQEEKILASARQITENPYHVFSIFDNAEMIKPQITLTDGSKITLNASNFSKFRKTENRPDRKNIFEVFWNNYKQYKNTLATNLLSTLKSHNFFAKNRKYDSCLEAALDENNIPVKIYENLINVVNQNLPVLHRYMKLKKKYLKLDTLNYYDLYVSFIPNVQMKFDLKESQEIIKTSLTVLGEEYQSTLNQALTSNWIDYMPSKGKRSGAYSAGSAYDAHPYILMNWNDDYESISTLTHELGHTLHSYLSNKYQPFSKSDYKIFVAEIASTLNENLLHDYLVHKVSKKQEKMFILGRSLEELRGTLFRQTLFAEFEWEIHKKVESHLPITGDILSELYLELLRKYYGHDENICRIDEVNAYEWAYIPHFYYNFYVYQYSTSIIYSIAIAENIKNQTSSAVERYLNLLKSGSSKYPVELIQRAGIDPLEPSAYQNAFKKMNSIMDEIENLYREP